MSQASVKWHRTTKSFHSDCILEFRNSIVGPDTFVGDVLGYPVEGRILGLNPIGRVRRVTHPWDGLD